MNLGLTYSRRVGFCLSDLFFRAWRLGWVGLGWEGNVELGPAAGSCHGRDLRCGARIPTLFLDDAWWLCVFEEAIMRGWYIASEDRLAVAAFCRIWDEMRPHASNVAASSQRHTIHVSLSVWSSRCSLARRRRYLGDET